MTLKQYTLRFSDLDEHVSFYARWNENESIKVVKDTTRNDDKYDGRKVYHYPEAGGRWVIKSS